MTADNEPDPAGRPPPKLRLFGREFTLPKSRPLRIAIGVFLVLCGFLGFLPVLGFWMAPLGLLVLSYEFHVVRRLRRRFIVWWEKRRRNGAAGALRDGQRPGGGSA